MCATFGSFTVCSFPLGAMLWMLHGSHQILNQGRSHTPAYPPSDHSGAKMVLWIQTLTCSRRVTAEHTCIADSFTNSKTICAKLCQLNRIFVVTSKLVFGCGYQPKLNMGGIHQTTVVGISHIIRNIFLPNKSWTHISSLCLNLASTHLSV